MDLEVVVPEAMAPDLLRWSNQMVAMYQASRTRQTEDAAATAAADFSDFMLEKVDAGKIGQASLELGAGRSKAGDSVDFSVGFDRLAKCGDKISAGGVIARIHASSKASSERAEAAVLEAVSIG